MDERQQHPFRQGSWPGINELLLRFIILHLPFVFFQKNYQGESERFSQKSIHIQLFAQEVWAETLEASQLFIVFRLGKYF